MSHAWPETPQERSAYRDLSTDFWPWPEVLADLAARPDFSGALELRGPHSGGGRRRARALFAQGELLGAHGEGADDDLSALMEAMPRAEVSLLALDPPVARLLWQCRDAEARREHAPWSEAREGLLARGFCGVVRAEAGDSCWLGGARATGPEPGAAERVTLLAPSVRAVGAAEIVAFFNLALSLLAPDTAARGLDLAPLWRASALDLADDHPCLDPFAREVVLDGGQLALLAKVPPTELLPALRGALRLTLARAGRHLEGAGFETLRAHPLWSLSDLGDA